MNIIIAGLGKIGASLCHELSNTENNITLIDNNPTILNKFANHYDVLAIEGHASYYDSLQEADVKHTDVFISVTPNDETNLIACITAKKMGAKYTIARVRNPHYTSNLQFLNRGLGVDMTINPELEAARSIARTIQFPHALSANPLANNRVSLLELEVRENDAYTGMSLSKFRAKHPGILICIIMRNHQAFIPSGNTILENGDRIFLTGLMKDMNQLYEKSEIARMRIRSALIIGGGTLTYYLLKILAPLGMNLKVIESNPSRCQELSEEFPNVTIIEGDGTDQDLLLEEHIDKYNCVISLTGIDEENVIASMFAESSGVSHTLTKVNRVKMLKVLATQTHLQRIITPAHISANRIVSLIRGIQNSMGSNVEMLYRLADNQVEALQFNVCQNSKLLHIPLMKLAIKPGTLIAYIIRNKELIFPQGRDEIHPSDHIIIITTQKNFDDIDDILERNE